METAQVELLRRLGESGRLLVDHEDIRVVREEEIIGSEPPIGGIKVAEDPDEQRTFVTIESTAAGNDAEKGRGELDLEGEPLIAERCLNVGLAIAVGVVPRAPGGLGSNVALARISCKAALDQRLDIAMRFALAQPVILTRGNLGRAESRARTRWAGTVLPNMTEVEDAILGSRD